MSSSNTTGASSIKIYMGYGLKQIIVPWPDGDTATAIEIIHECDESGVIISAELLPLFLSACNTVADAIKRGVTKPEQT